jgi:hypothetical protein
MTRFERSDEDHHRCPTPATLQAMDSKTTLVPGCVWVHGRGNIPSAVLTIWLCKGVCQFTLIVSTDPLDEFRHGEHTSGFHDGPFPMHPLGLNRIEPGTLAR